MNEAVLGFTCLGMRVSVFRGWEDEGFEKLLWATFKLSFRGWNPGIIN